MINKKIFRFSLAVFCLCLVMACETRKHSLMREEKHLAAHQLEPVAHYWRGVVYGVANGTTLTLDVSAPEDQGPFPVLMIIHGGEWRLNTNRAMEGMARYIANRGYVVVNINTRMLPEVRMEDEVGDCFSALLWIKGNVRDYGGDPSKIAVTGDSSGGHLAAMIVTSGGNPALPPSVAAPGKPDLAVSCAVISYGFLDFVTMGRILPVTRRWLGKSYWQDPARHQLFSPLRQVRPGLPPQLVVEGNLDFLYQENLKYVKALTTAGDPVELYIAPGQAHGFLDRYWEPATQAAYDRIIAFLDRQLKGR